MKLKRCLLAGLSAGLLALFVAPSAEAASYDVQGAYTPGENCDVGDVCDRLYTYSGTASCRSRCAFGPDSGTFTISLSGQGGFPPSPCVSKTVSGNLLFQPTDPNYPGEPMFGPVSGHNVDYQGIRFDGTISSPLLPGEPMKGFVSYPETALPGDPWQPLIACSPGQFEGTLNIAFPADPA